MALFVMALGAGLCGIVDAHTISAASSLTRASSANWLAATMPMLVAAILYALGATNLWRAQRRSRYRLLVRISAFGAGLGVLGIALLSPLDRVSAELFSAHMVQHELIMLAAAPLLVLGHPLPLFLWAFPGRARPGLVTFFHGRLIRRIWSVLSGAGCAWLLHALALWVWHVPRFFNAGLSRQTVHDLQHLTFLAAALLFWSALFEARGAHQRGAGIVYLFTTTIHTAVLGALIALASNPWYAESPQPSMGWQLTSLEDQQLGGLIMWVPGCIVYVGCALVLFARWITASTDLPVRGAGGARDGARV